MDFEENPENFNPDPPDRRADPDADNVYEPPPKIFIPSLPGIPRDLPINPQGQPNDELDELEKPEVFNRDIFKSEILTTVKKENFRNVNEFALTPKDHGYFEVIKEIPTNGEETKSK